MVKNHHLSKSIHDAGWSKFVDMLEYKADWYGRDVFKVNRFYPSSKTCSNCGFAKADLKLSDRKWICPECGMHHDRDINASINLFLEGLKIGQELPELTPAEYAPAGMQNMEFSVYKAEGFMLNEMAYSRHTSKQEASRFIEG